MSARVTQSEARRLRARVRKLEAERTALVNRWGEDYVGVFLASADASPAALSAVTTAHKLRHVVATRVYNDKLHFYALPVDGTR